jgi:hypothetical protein
MNAKVTLSITELDSLRDAIKGLTQRCDEYQKNEKQVKLVLVDKHTYFSAEQTFGGVGYNRWARYDAVPKDRVVECVSYQNMEPIIEVLTKEAEDTVTDKLNKLNNENIDLQTQIRKQHDNHLDEIKELSVKTQKNLKIKDDEIKRLNGENVDLDKDATIIELRNKLQKFEVSLVEFNKLSVWKKLSFKFNL